MALLKSHKLVMRIHGGLGNQLFQHAYIFALAKRHNANYLLDLSAYQEYKVRKPELSKFEKVPPYADNLQIPFYERFPTLRKQFRLLSKFFWFCKKINPYDYQEKSKGFEEKFLSITQWYIRGFFQTEKYFQEYKSEILELFAFTQETEKTVQSFIEKEGINNIDQYVAISIRRWDFAVEKNHYLIPFQFYFWAKEKYFSDKKIIVFSDDQKWCAKQFWKSKLSIILTEGLTGIEQLCLMKNCKNFIISNSTFSRWGAYLSLHKDKKIIRPLLKFDQDHKGDAYMKDHYPDEWIPYPFWF